MSKKGFIIVSTTIDTQARAERLAALIVKSKLAACVQCLPIKSIYRWKGKVEKTREVLLLSKTRAALSGPLTAFIKKHHSYEVPEIVVTGITDGSNDYLSWIEAETKNHD